MISINHFPFSRTFFASFKLQYIDYIYRFFINLKLAAITIDHLSYKKITKIFYYLYILLY